MLTPAPYEVPEKTAKKMAAGTRKGLWRKMVLSDSSSDESDAHSSHGNEEEEKSSPPQPGETRKVRPTHPGRPKVPRRERPFLRTVGNVP